MLNKIMKANSSVKMEHKTISKNYKFFNYFINCLVLFVLLFSSTSGLFSQDIITKKDGSEIEAKVTEVGTNEVKYLRFGTTSPIYTLLKSEIFMIKYENGDKDVFNEVSVPAQQQEVIADNTVVSDQNQKKYKYTLGKTINPVGGRKSPFGSGIASFFIPGLGQFINGDVGAGFIFLGSNIVCNLVWMSAFEVDAYGDVYYDEDVFTIGFIGAVITNVLAIIDAAKIANRVNIARGYKLADDTYLKIQPTLIPQHNGLSLSTNNNFAYGLSFRLSF